VDDALREVEVVEGGGVEVWHAPLFNFAATLQNVCNLTFYLQEDYTTQKPLCFCIRAFPCNLCTL
jgi:hypothetical protein